MNICLFSQNGISPGKILVDNDTLITMTEDMLLEVNILITENNFLLQNVDSLSEVLSECNENYKIQDYAIIAMNKQFSTLEQIRKNQNNTINMLDEELRKSKKHKTFLIGGCVLSFILGILI